jgi:hypothetical protein
MLTALLNTVIISQTYFTKIICQTVLSRYMSYMGDKEKQL